MGCKSLEKKVRKPNPNNIKNNDKENHDQLIEYFQSNARNNLNKDNIKEYLEHLFQSYYFAMNYFKSNDFKDKELDSIRKCSKIKLALDLLKNGEYQKIKINELPEEISSKYITGYSKEERKEEIEKIINYLKKEKEYAIKNRNRKMNQLQLESKKCKKENIQQFKEKIGNILNKENEKINLLTKHIEKMNEILKNEYIPIPDYIIVNQECSIEKVNEEIQQNQLCLTIKNLTYKESNPKIKLDIINKEKEIQCKKGYELNETFKWEFYEENFINLFKEKINLKLYKDNYLKGSAEIPLNKLKDNNQIEKTIEIQMENEENITYIDLIIKIREALIETQYEKKEEEFVRIKKYYPKFEKSEYYYIIKKKDLINQQMDNLNINKIGNEIKYKENKDFVEKKEDKEKKVYKEKETIEISNNNQKRNEKKENANNIYINNKKKIEDKKINKENNNKKIEDIDTNTENKIKNENFYNQNLKQNKEKINKNNININEKINKSIFKEEELKDVDYIDNLNSIKVLEDRLKEMEKIILKIDGRTPKEILQKKIKISFKLNQLKKQMNEGEIEPKDYLFILESQKNHDFVLFNFLKQENRIDDAKKVISRINLLNEEIKELKEFYKKK